MKPKEKAEYLIEKFRDENYFSEKDILENAKCNSLIVVEEILKETLSEYTNDENHDRVEYWNDVKLEIEKMN